LARFDQCAALYTHGQPTACSISPPLPRKHTPVTSISALRVQWLRTGLDHALRRRRFSPGPRFPTYFSVRRLISWYARKDVQRLCRIYRLSGHVDIVSNRHYLTIPRITQEANRCFEIYVRGSAAWLTIPCSVPGLDGSFGTPHRSETLHI